MRLWYCFGSRDRISLSALVAIGPVNELKWLRLGSKGVMCEKFSCLTTNLLDPSVTAGSSQVNRQKRIAMIRNFVLSQWTRSVHLDLRCRRGATGQDGSGYGLNDRIIAYCIFKVIHTHSCKYHLINLVIQALLRSQGITNCAVPFNFLCLPTSNFQAPPLWLKPTSMTR